MKNRVLASLDETAGGEPAARDTARSRESAHRIWIALLVACLAITAAALALEALQTGVSLSRFLFDHQDRFFLPFVFSPLLLRPDLETRPPPISSLWHVGAITPLLVATGLALIGWGGHYVVFDHYDFARDEQLADFDAYVFAHGRLAWPIAESWRGFIKALNNLFMLPMGGQAWISAYLPINALCRALLGLLADAALTGPLFVAAGALALWRIGARLWPDAPDRRLVALCLYAGSAQVVLTGMTAYAMSAHLGLNLVWLFLFLRDRKASHVGAVGLGFLATGLHQPLFHPLFVLPFLDLLRRKRRWRLLACYVGAYSVIGAFWFAWPVWMSRYGVHPPLSAPGNDYVSRLVGAVHVFSLAQAWEMIANLLRALTWQHLLLLPLLSLGCLVAVTDKTARALAIGLALPILVMAVLLPAQGHGWGYRYLHGVIGNACLLGAYGWGWLETRGLTLRRPFIWASAATVFVALPVHAVMAHRMVMPYVKASRMIASIDADIVIVDDASVPWSQDLVINRPDLTNRPIRLRATGLQKSDMAELCRRGTISFVGERQLAPIDIMFGLEPSDITIYEKRLEEAARAAHCNVVVP